MYPKGSYPLTVSALANVIAQRTDSTVVERGGRVVAFANFYRAEYGGCCSIGNVIVSPTARRRGVGRYLIEAMIAKAFSTYDAAEVQLSAFHENLSGLLLYPKLGFQPYAIEAYSAGGGKVAALIHMRLGRPQ